MKPAALACPPAGNSSSANLKPALIRLHRILAWVGFSAALLWGLSGLLHPWLTTFGVQQQVFSAPQRQLNLSNAQPLERILATAGIRQAVAVKMVPGETDLLLQITENQHSPRRYFDLQTGRELPDHDPVHAVFLARHYMNLPTGPVRSIQRISEFSESYPAVNRLLPVYQVNFDRPDGLQVYIYTETGAVAGVSNHVKQAVQTAFQWFHTWSWMPAFAETPRVLLIAGLVGAVFLMACSGMAMLLLIRRKVQAAGARRLHRFAAGFALLPLLMFSFSGVYHLIQHGWPSGQAVIRMQPPMQLAGLSFPLHVHWAELSANIQLTGLSVVVNRDGALLYRVSLPTSASPLPQGDQAIRHARFQGVQPTGPALYLHAASGKAWPEGDREMALQLAEMHTGLDRSAISDINLVTRFGGDYDFRNKRLPVWRIVYADPRHESIFIDTATGVLADRTARSAKPEIWSFSMLHKWNFLGALGRNVQNLLMCVAVGLIVLTAALGLKSRFRR